VNGRTDDELVDMSARVSRVEAISSDGKYLLVEEDPVAAEDPERSTGYDIAVIQLGVDGEKAVREPWLRMPGNQVDPRISSNGRWVAYASDRAIYVRPFSGEGDEFKVSRDQAQNPMWSPNGDVVYFTTYADGQVSIMKAKVISGLDDASEHFKTAAAESVLKLPSEFSFHRTVDPVLMPDGKSMLWLVGAHLADRDVTELTDPAVIHIVRNFLSELNRLSGKPEARQDTAATTSP
jgi:Tol biopolymer transport system component